ncbi:MAG: twin-arginine translocase subunit TatC, partial [Anaerolineales bacterium]
MRNFFTRLGQDILVYFRVLVTIIIFPFKLIFNMIVFPLRALYKFNQFLNTVPEERPLGDIFSDIVNNEETRNALWEQVDNLRAHLLRSVLMLTLTVIIAFWFAQDVMAFLAEPVGGLQNLQAIQVTEEIGVFMRVSMSVGIAFAFPYIAFEVWLFAAYGMYPREKKMGLAGIPLAALLFLTGMAFTFYVLLPAALPFLGSFTEISQFWAAKEYFNFVTGLMFWIGLFFEFPLVIFVLTSMGLVKPQILAEQWRLAVVIIAILAAAITPTVDPINMGLVMLPMILLYFISIGLSYIAE